MQGPRGAIQRDQVGKVEAFVKVFFFLIKDLSHDLL